MSATCTIIGCDLPLYVQSRGWCSRHYNRWRAYGTPTPTIRLYGDDDARFFARVEKTDTCWLWRGQAIGKQRKYGKFSVGTKKVWAHRWAYERWVGQIPAGHEIDHLCRVPLCVRPEHLEAVTKAENLRREAAARAGHQ